VSLFVKFRDAVDDWIRITKEADEERVNACRGQDGKEFLHTLIE
jgi:hypothetical protein